MDAISCTETSVNIDQITWYDIPKYGILTTTAKWCHVS